MGDRWNVHQTAHKKHVCPLGLEPSGVQKNGKSIEEEVFINLAI